MIDAIRNPHLSRERRWKHVVFRVARVFVALLLKITVRMNVVGTKHVPRRGGAVMICNHLDWFDPLILLASSPRPIMFMAKAEFLKLPILRWFALGAGAFPVRRGTPDLSALRHANQLLDEGMLVGMFPEGTRSKTGALQTPFAGASLVATRSHAPIIPCVVIGTEDLPMSGSRHVLPRRRWYPRVSVVVGDPFVLETHRPDGSRYALGELTDAMMIELARLLPPQYRGLYADQSEHPHPAVRRDGVQFTGPGRSASS